MSPKANHLATNISFLSARLGISLITVAEQTGIDPSTLYRLADPEASRQPRARTLRTLADYFHVDPVFLLTKDLRDMPVPSQPDDTYAPSKKSPDGAAKPQSAAGMIPVIRITDPEALDPSIVQLFTDDYEFTELLGFTVSTWIKSPHDLDGQSLIAYEMVGDAMYPTLQHGDLLFVAGFENAVFEDQPKAITPGDLALVKVKINTRVAVTVRRACRNDFEELVLCTDNPNFKHENPVLINTLGVVVGYYRNTLKR